MITVVHTVRKNEKFSHTEKIFREINSLITSSKKCYFHEILVKKCDRELPQFPHSSTYVMNRKCLKL